MQIFYHSVGITQECCADTKSSECIEMHPKPLRFLFVILFRIATTNFAWFCCYHCFVLTRQTYQENGTSILLRDKNIHWKKMERVIVSYVTSGTFCVKITSQCREIQ